MLSPTSNLRELASRRAALIVSVCLLLVLIAPIFIYHFNSSSFGYILASSNGAANDAEASAIEVKRGSVKKVLLLDGELRAVRSRTIFGGSSFEDVKIVYMPPEGTVVKAGDLALELDSTNTLNKIKDTDEKIVAAENEIVRVKSQHESALRDLEVELSKLWLVYEQAKKKEQAAELQVKIIEKDKLKVQLDRARSDLDGMKIKAPTDGMVLYNDHWNERRKLQIGDVVWPGWPVVQ